MTEKISQLAQVATWIRSRGVQLSITYGHSGWRFRVKHPRHGVAIYKYKLLEKETIDLAFTRGLDDAIGQWNAAHMPADTPSC